MSHSRTQGPGLLEGTDGEGGDLLSAGVLRTPEPVCRSKSQLCQAVGLQQQALGMGGWSQQAVKED